MSGKAWVSGKAQVYDKAWVYGKAQVSDEARVSGKAWVFDEARVSGKAQVSGKAWVSGDSAIGGSHSSACSGVARPDPSYDDSRAEEALALADGADQGSQRTKLREADGRKSRPLHMSTAIAVCGHVRK